MKKVLIQALSIILLTAQVYAGHKKPGLSKLYSEAIEMYRKDASYWYSEHQKSCKRLSVIDEIKKTVRQNLWDEYYKITCLLKYNVALQKFLQTSHTACLTEIKSAQSTIARHKKVTSWKLPPTGKNMPKKERYAFSAALQRELHDANKLLKWMTALNLVQKECAIYFGEDHINYLKKLDTRLVEIQQKLVLESQ